MRYGIYNINKVNLFEDVVLCNNCQNYYYNDITDERNNNSLAFFFDINHFFKGCPVCLTDDYLCDIELSKNNQER